MKPFLILLCVAAGLCGCTREIMDEVSSDHEASIGVARRVAAGTVAVRLSPEAAAKASLLQSRSGVDEIDQALAQAGVTGMERLWAYDPQWEHRYATTGINRWFALYFDESIEPEQVARRLASTKGIERIELPLDPRFRHPQRVRTAVKNRRTSADQKPATRATAVMNDPYLTYQWHYDNPGDNSAWVQPPKAGEDIALTDAWSLCTGDPRIVVAVIDEPVYTEHPDLKANIWSSPTTGEHGYNFYNKSAQLDWKSYDTERDGRETYYYYADHGSHVAGTVAAVNDNNTGVCGIAGGRNGNGVKIMSCQIMGYSNRNTDPYAEIKAFEYALKNGAVIAQNSWGYGYDDDYTPTDSQNEWERGTDSNVEALKSAMDTFIAYAGADNPDSPIEGGLVIFAAGNDGDVYQDVKIYPAAYSPMIAVAACDWSGKPAYYTDYGSWVDITAPGGDVCTGAYSDGEIYVDGQVFSTVLCDPTMNFKDDRTSSDYFGYDFMQGTSMAAPHVTGVAALGLSYAAQLGKRFTAAEFKALLLGSVRGIDGNFVGTKRFNYPEYDLSVSMQLTNYRDKMGGGCVDALKLLLAIKGTPALQVKTGQAATLDFAEYFGGAASKVKITSVSCADWSVVGVSGEPVVSGTKLSLTCASAGMVLVTVHAKAGDTEISREFALVSRPNFASNGAWL